RGRGLGAETTAAAPRLILGERCAQGQQECGVEPALHVRYLGLDHLEAADRLAERLALARVVERGLVRRARKPDRLRCDADAARIEHAHRDLEALALFTDLVVRGNAAVAELDLAGCRCADAEFGF